MRSHAARSAHPRRANYRPLASDDTLRAMREIPFAELNDAHRGGAAIVVGKGPTLFDYAELGTTGCPTFFVNDAVALERHLQPDQPSYWFAHDRIQTAWLERGIQSTAVVPEDGKLLTGRGDPVLANANRVVFYRWRTRLQDVVLAQTRDELAASRELHTDQGTIHSLLHFVWYLGFTRVGFVGCDGISKDPRTAPLEDASTGYDKRIENASSSAPWGTFLRIRREQDRLCKLFRFETTYLGTPAERGLVAEANESVRATWRAWKRNVLGSRH